MCACVRACNSLFWSKLRTVNISILICINRLLYFYITIICWYYLQSTTIYFVNVVNNIYCLFVVFYINQSLIVICIWLTQIFNKYVGIIETINNFLNTSLLTFFEQIVGNRVIIKFQKVLILHLSKFHFRLVNYKSRTKSDTNNPAATEALYEGARDRKRLWFENYCYLVCEYMVESIWTSDWWHNMCVFQQLCKKTTETCKKK